MPVCLGSRAWVEVRTVLAIEVGPTIIVADNGRLLSTVADRTHHTHHLSRRTRALSVKWNGVGERLWVEWGQDSARSEESATCGPFFQRREQLVLSNFTCVDIHIPSMHPIHRIPPRTRPQRNAAPLRQPRPAAVMAGVVHRSTTTPRRFNHHAPPTLTPPPAAGATRRPPRIRSVRRPIHYSMALLHTPDRPTPKQTQLTNQSTDPLAAHLGLAPSDLKPGRTLDLSEAQLVALLTTTDAALVDALYTFAEASTSACVLRWV